MSKKNAVMIITVVVGLAVSQAWSGQARQVTGTEDLLAALSYSGSGYDQDQKEKEAEKFTKPVVIQKVNPSYPAEAKKEKVSGDVLVRVTIGKDGSVLDTKIEKDADARLAQSAMEAVKQWKFKPALDPNGKPVEAKATLTIRFKLQ